MLTQHCQAEGVVSALPFLFSRAFSFTSLLDQFVSVSYSDPLFASFVTLPLQQRFSVQLRRDVWDENPSVLRVLSLPLAQVWVAVVR